MSDGIQVILTLLVGLGILVLGYVVLMTILRLLYRAKKPRGKKVRESLDDYLPEREPEPYEDREDAELYGYESSALQDEESE